MKKATLAMAAVVACLLPVEPSAEAVPRPRGDQRIPAPTYTARPKRQQDRKQRIGRKAARFRF